MTNSHGKKLKVGNEHFSLPNRSAMANVAGEKALVTCSDLVSLCGLDLAWLPRREQGGLTGTMAER